MYFFLELPFCNDIIGWAGLYLNLTQFSVISGVNNGGEGSISEQIILLGAASYFSKFKSIGIVHCACSRVGQFACAWVMLSVHKDIKISFFMFFTTINVSVICDINKKILIICYCVFCHLIKRDQNSPQGFAFGGIFIVILHDPSLCFSTFVTRGGPT